MFANMSYHGKSRMNSHKKVVMLDMIITLIYCALWNNKIIPIEFFTHETVISLYTLLFNTNLIILLFMYTLNLPYQYVGDELYDKVKYLNKIVLNARLFSAEEIWITYIIAVLSYVLLQSDMISIPLGYFSLVCSFINLFIFCKTFGNVHKKIYSAKFDKRLKEI